MARWNSGITTYFVSTAASSRIFQANANEFEYHIQLNTEEPLVKRNYPIPFIYSDQVRSHIRKWLDLGVIKPGLSKNSCPLIVAKKKNGKIRVCLDLTLTNAHATQELLKAERIGNLLVRFHGVKLILNLDLNDSYTQVSLDKESQDVIAFTSEGQIYTFSRMIYGYINRSVALQYALQKTCGFDLSQKLILYVDISIPSLSADEHFATLDELFTKLSDAGMTVNQSQCSFMSATTIFLGIKISSKRIQKYPSCMEKIRKLQPPKNIKAL